MTFNMIKRNIIIGLFLLAITISGVGFYLYRFIGEEGSTSLENWLGNQVVSLLQSQLNPTIEFDSIDYQAPRTLMIDGLRIVEDGSVMIQVARTQLEFASIPTVGEAFQIEQIILTEPHFRLEESEEGGLVRWSHFLKDSPEPDTETDLVLSDVLQMRHIAINNGVVEYIPFGDSPPMLLEGLTTTIDTHPNSTAPGVYVFDGTLERPNLFTIKTKGELNLNTLHMDLASLYLNTHLHPDGYAIFPPQAQGHLIAHEIRGDLELEASGEIQLDDWQSASITTTCTLRNGFFAYSDKAIPLDTFTVLSQFADQTITLHGVAELMEGTIRFDAMASMKEEQPIHAEWAVNGIELSHLIRTLQPNERPVHAGLIQSNGVFEADATAWPDSIHGDGVVTISKGRLINIPILKLLAFEFLKMDGMKSASRKDSALVEFNFLPKSIGIKRFHASSGAYSSGAVRARGRGMIFYDGHMDMELNADALGKIQSKLGGSGKLLGEISDSVVKYRITGTPNQPKISVQPLGIPIGPGR